MITQQWQCPPTPTGDNHLLHIVDDFFFSFPFFFWSFQITKTKRSFWSRFHCLCCYHTTSCNNTITGGGHLDSIMFNKRGNHTVCSMHKWHFKLWHMLSSFIKCGDLYMKVSWHPKCFRNPWMLPSLHSDISDELLNSLNRLREGFPRW